MSMRPAPSLVATNTKGEREMNVRQCRSSLDNVLSTTDAATGSPIKMRSSSSERTTSVNCIQALQATISLQRKLSAKLQLRRGTGYDLKNAATNHCRRLSFSASASQDQPAPRIELTS